jgi:3-oxoacyl-[acyl-carrier-protein] synthase III
MAASIVGIGVWLPEDTRRNTDWPASFVEEGSKRGERTLNDILLSDDPRSAELMRPYQTEEGDPFLGATVRRVARTDETTRNAATQAASAALEDAGIPAHRVTHLIGYDLVPDVITPPTATAVAYALRATDAHAFSVDGACATALTAMELAEGLLRADPTRVILAFQTHLLLRAMPLLHPATPGLGDAATAFVMAESGSGLGLRSVFGVTHGEFHDAVLWRRGSGEYGDTPWYLPGSDGFRLGTRVLIGVKYLQKETIAFGARTVEEAARRARISTGHIDVLCSVQPRSYIPGCIAERLDLPRDAAVTTYDEIAHVGGCGPIANLHAARDRGRLVPGTVVALYGQGAGFTRSGAILEVAR